MGRKPRIRVLCLVLCGLSEALTPAQAISWDWLPAQLSDSIETTSPNTTHKTNSILICNNTSESLTRRVIRSDPVPPTLTVSGTKVRLVQARANCVSVNQSPPGQSWSHNTKKSETSREWRLHREQEGERASVGVKSLQRLLVTRAPGELSPANWVHPQYQHITFTKIHHSFKLLEIH